MATITVAEAKETINQFWTMLLVKLIFCFRILHKEIGIAMTHTTTVDNIKNSSSSLTEGR